MPATDLAIVGGVTGELLAYALHRGRRDGQGGGGTVLLDTGLPSGSIAEAGMFHPSIQDASATTSTTHESHLGPFFPLEYVDDASHSAAERDRYSKWQAGLHKGYEHVGLGLDFNAESLDKPPASSSLGTYELASLQVLRILPGGPAARTGLIEKGMFLISIDGVRVDRPGSGVDPRQVMSERFGLYKLSADGKNAARLQSFRTLQWANLAKTAFRGLHARELADAGLLLAADGQVKCGCCGVTVPDMSTSPSLVDAMRLHLPASCPLTDPAHLQKVEAAHGAPPVDEHTPDTPPHHLSSGIMLGFLPMRSNVVMVSDAGLSAEDLASVVYVWLRPEPVAPLLPAGM